MNDIAFAIEELLVPAVEEYGGIDVRYRSFHSGNVYTFRARIGSAEVDAETTEGLSVVLNVTTFKFPRSYLTVQPQHLDTIEQMDEDGNVVAYFDVLEESGTRAVEPGDHQRRGWTVYAKEKPAPEPLKSTYGNASGFGYGNNSGVGYGSARR